ncbi:MULTISPECIES: DUF6710 family protein [Paenibacillus]|uniref:DUF6710 family protein n=1 Tax=Paenibacillus TaxID=44249 RepID=UPI00096DEA5D|nr:MULTISPECIES: DUF6710 family protein [Paenibacillus]OMF76860.1 hypothetical protein BK145_20180 [Paenibacillus peoriae]QYK59925.1 hypothetical protein KAI37_00207 [Paenibacillus sp. S25]
MRKHKPDKETIERENKQRRELNRILMTAKKIIKQSTTYQDTHPIYLLIKQLVDQELYKNIYNSISTHDPNKVREFSIADILPFNSEKKIWNYQQGNFLYVDEFGNGVIYSEFIEQSKLDGKKASIRLGFDSVLTRPWNEERLVRAYSNIGMGKPSGDWIEDSNHDAVLWLPFGVTIVNNGNHSITTGIINNEGMLKIYKIYDISKIYRYIYCDGANFFRKSDNSLYTPVENFSMAIVFEIGRLISENIINFKELEHVK